MNTTSHEGFHATPKTSGLAIASLVCGILCIPIVPIVLGHIALSQIKRAAGVIVGGGMAIAGLVLGYVLLVFFLILIILSTLAFGSMGSILSSASRDASGQNLKSAYQALQLESRNGQVKWPGKETIGSAQNFAVWFVKKTAMDDANVWFLPNDPVLDELDDENVEIPQKVLHTEGSLDQVKKAFGYNIAVPPTLFSTIKQPRSGPFPIMWTRGLDTGETEWGDSSPWEGQGGHVLYSNGKVEWIESTQTGDRPEGVFKKFRKRDDPGEDSYTSDIGDAIPDGWEILKPGG